MSPLLAIVKASVRIGPAEMDTQFGSVKLICAFAGDAFAVYVDEGASVGYLRKAIEKMHRVPTAQPQLFLAKTDDGTWLTLTGVEDVTALSEHSGPHTAMPIVTPSSSNDELRSRK
jgi:hypothetical protein